MNEQMTAKAREIVDQAWEHPQYVGKLQELIAAALAAERKAGREEVCRIWAKLRDEHAKNCLDAEGYRRGLDEAAEILQSRLDQIRSGVDLYAVPGHDMAKALEAELVSLMGMIREGGK